jgi:hypothetical protein
MEADIVENLDQIRQSLNNQRLIKQVKEVSELRFDKAVRMNHGHDGDNKAFLYMNGSFFDGRWTNQSLPNSIMMERFPRFGTFLRSP